MTTSEVESRIAALEKDVANLHRLLEQSRIAARIRRGLDQADRGEALPARKAGLTEQLRKKKRLELVALFGTVDYDPDYNYKDHRSRKKSFRKDAKK